MSYLYKLFDCEMNIRRCIKMSITIQVPETTQSLRKEAENGCVLGACCSALSVVVFCCVGVAGPMVILCTVCSLCCLGACQCSGVAGRGELSPHDPRDNVHSIHVLGSLI